MCCCHIKHQIINKNEAGNQTLGPSSYMANLNTAKLNFFRVKFFFSCPFFLHKTNSVGILNNHNTAVVTTQMCDRNNEYRDDTYYVKELQDVHKPEERAEPHQLHVLKNSTFFSQKSLLWSLALTLSLNSWSRGRCEPPSSSWSRPLAAKGGRRKGKTLA